MAKEQGFEQSLAELAQIVGELEGGELALEDSMARYEKGVAILKKCRGMLDAAEKKIEVLVKNEQGESSVKPFEPEAAQ